MDEFKKSLKALVERIKENFPALKGIEVSDKSAFFLTITSLTFLIIIFFLIINFVFPKPKIDIKITGPKTAIAGEQITYKVSIKNKGRVVLENPELVFYFPPYSLPEKSLIETISLNGKLFPGQEENIEFKAQLFGKEKEEKEVKTWLSYRTKKNGKILISKTVNLITSITEIPIDLVIEVPEKIAIFPERESEFSFRIKYFSLLNHDIENLKLLITYPQNLKIEETIPLIKEGNYWQIPKLEGFAGQEVEIFGLFKKRQKIEEKLNFNAKLFVILGETEILLKEHSVNSTTFYPRVQINQLINSKENYSPLPGENLHYEVYFKNIDEKPLSNLTLSVVLNGNLFDFSTIQAPSGDFQPGGYSVLWKEEKVPQLRYLLPGEEGKIEFWVQLKEDYRPKDLTEINTIIKNRIALDNFEKDFRNKVGSRIKITQEGYFKDKYNFFENTGSQPPKVNKTTYYTIVWKLENYYNQIKNVLIRANLPERVAFRSVKSTYGEIKVVTDSFEIESSYYPIIPKDFQFKNLLHQNLRNEEVRYLQIILKKEVPFVYRESIPATGYFGLTTLEAVKAFQEKHKKEILIPQGITKPTGAVDEFTRLKLNQLLKEGMPFGSSEVVWQIENVNPGIGVFEDELIAAFQIAFTPEMSQKNEIATLISEVTISAIDQWSGTTLFSVDKLIDTTLIDDRSVSEGKIK